MLGNSKALTSTAKRLGDQSGRSVSLSSDGTTVAIGALLTTATALTPVTFVFTHGIALQVLGNSKALTSTAKRLVIIAAIAFHFPPTARRLLLGRHITTATALTPVTFVFTHGIATTSAWEQQGADIDGEAAGDYSGSSVSLSSDGTTVAIGARS